MNENDNIRVLIVDDHGMVRSGLRQFLSVYDDIELIGEAKDGFQAIELCRQTKPDVVLMDLVMPDIDGAQATHTILAENPQIRIIALTSFQEQNLIEQVLQAGAISFLMKNIPAQELAQAIRSASAGRSTLAPEAMQVLLHSNEGKSGLGSDLTQREREVLDLLVDGLSNPEISERLFISLATVKFHVSAIYSKLGAANRAEAVKLAWQHDLVDKP
jgi:NarL family two-component system response regulator LiaR